MRFSYSTGISTSSPIQVGFKLKLAFNKAIPPPDTIPSLIAAFVAQIASSTLSLFSFSSNSELAPTLTVATLAFNLANLFSSLTKTVWICSFFYIDFLVSFNSISSTSVHYQINQLVSIVSS